ncbi:helix-turn-helix domain-containing protein [Prochlorothrix hollandica]|uniref:Uncharacterized protein n=1 Tax=Prochlorothrix hollandica PCC 9006 = CALU 1027 TaxID=317619 RepID=A0A0M2PVF5_PROHO|nr:helix-turn-helix domain-containing protein [Prochlorothrix hollandica]KKI98668.1 hypothetical protein PROH_17590 [Prochlorothrix hollandica PCC 9006 = CALU 1027]
MAPSKLSEDDKHEILNLYRQTDETTSTLAQRFGVSVSTISRFLKNKLSATEYNQLMRKKRQYTSRSEAEIEAEIESEDQETDPSPASMADVAPQEPVTAAPSRAGGSSSTRSVPRRSSVLPPLKATETNATQTDTAEADQFTSDQADVDPVSGRRKRRRSSAPTSPSTPEPSLDSSPPVPRILPPIARSIPEAVPIILSAPVVTSFGSGGSGSSTPTVPAPTASTPTGLPLPSRPTLRSTAAPTQISLWSTPEDDSLELEEEEDQAMAEYLAALGEDGFGASSDEDDDDFDDEDLEESESPAPVFFVGGDRRSDHMLQVLPLAVANLPDIAYLVIDRTAELVTCPLHTFQELGSIPMEEADRRTLPLFDNHRVARRFSKANQRVIKFPNPGMLHKTLTYLEAKGITRLLVDGQVYSLEN